MYLKKLELCGFKSFADRTVLSFEQGVSSIIGPNGCGKSNISDAIRWCLGEQRAKSMRSKAMQDVIFSGTKSRAATGMAEVTLVFDNSNNAIPIDYSEVAITRRLFRSGESEYFINKNQCRLKDIRDLFLDTGIGSGGYSIIEQNKVEELVMATPEIRREFFEEVAGVAKYKARREETLHRLDRIETDMARLKDSLNIYEDQIKKLDIQARKAKQYKKYQEELAKYEIADIVNNLARGYEQIEQLKKDLEPKIREFETTNTFLTQLETEVEELRLAQIETDEKYVSLNNEHSQLKSSVTISDSNIKNLRQKDTELINEQGRLKTEIEESGEKISKYENDILTLNTNDDGIEDEVASLKVSFEQKEKDYNDLRAKLAGFETQENEAREKIYEFEQQKDSLINSKTNIYQEQSEANAEVGSLTRQIERLQSEIQPSTDDIENDNKALADAHLQLEELTKKEEESKQVILNIETEISNLREKESSLKQETAAIEARISTLKEMAEHDPIRASVKAVIDAGFAKNTVSSVIAPAEDKIETVAAALGDKLDYLICDTEAQAEDGVKFLKDNDLYKLTFIILEKLTGENVPDGADSEKGAELFSMLNCSAENEKIGRFVSYGTYVSDDKIYTKATVFGGAKNLSDKPVLVEEQIKKLSGDITAKKLEAEVLEKEISEQEDKELNVNLDGRTNSNEKTRVALRIEYLKETIEQKKANISETVDEIEKLKNEQSVKKQLADSVNEKFAEIDNRLAEIEIEKSRLEEVLQNIETESGLLKNEQEQKHQEYMDASTRFTQRQSDLNNRQQGKKYIEDNIANLKEQITAKTARISEIDKALEEILQTQQSETSNIQKYNEEMIQKETELQLVKSKRDEILASVEQKNIIIHETRIKTDALRQEVSDMEGDQKSFITQKNFLETRIKETYGKTFDELKDEYLGVEVDKEAISKIKKKMEDMGQVNMAAQEEYDQLSQRYDFIVTQQNDLVKAKKDLEEVIQKINNTTVENFKKTFDVVRENFKAQYKKLFGGGDADLTLTDENNLLESGVDISAQPPGKAVKNILQCSGGEKALTAVALLFSFFLTKPSPFCILDEVDAPLDDANIGRYINVINEFAQKTQFLVVTHNKRTMEMADVLYGVTMAEQGISKMISVRMSRDSEQEIDQILESKPK